MQSERWQSCTEIFSVAVAQPPNERADILARRCNGDHALRRGVELLLKYHDTSGDFIQTPAFEVAPDLLVGDPAALLGQRLGSYRLDALLGAGGMGVVYLAYDERLERKVALKLLPSLLAANDEQLQGLQREARTASALNHPNIVTIHEIGEVDSTHFIATEFIEGTTLREEMSKGPVPPEKALEITIQLASALCVAHRAGIVHRDIKPENIMLRPDGYVKVLDFGIAKLMEPKLPTGVDLMTRHGVIVGTTRYMSPEQVKGETADARSDLWSLGAVLYEMLAGSPPFDGKRPSDVMDKIVLNEPKPLPPSALQKVIDRALQKDPADRYPAAEEMLSDLREKRKPRYAQWIGASAVAALLLVLAIFYSWRGGQADRAGALPAGEKSIAVLPFENLSAEPDNAFLADGIHDDVITGLAKIKDLKVIARGSVMSYRGAATAGKLREIGRSLGVAHLLQGSVRRAQNRVVVNVALVDARNQEHKWAQRYERTFSDALSLQGELAVDIARELRATLTPAEATVAAGKPTQNPQAYLLYLRARAVEIEGWSPQEQEAAIKLYQQAIDLDPNFALARARLSICASQRGQWGGPTDWKAKARTEAEEAVRIRPELGEAHLALTRYYLFGEDDNNRALHELDRAAELLPNSAEVPLTAAFIYKRQARFRERIAALQRAEALDPLNRTVLLYLINTFRWVRDWREAMHAFDRSAAVTVTPEWRSCSLRWCRAHDQFQLSGDINALKKAIAEQPDAEEPATRDLLNFQRYETATLERDYTEAARLLAAVPSALMGETPDSPSPHWKAFHEALLAVAANTEGKQETLERARIVAETRAWAVPEPPGSDRPQEDLALLYAFLGRKEDAIRQAQHAIDLAPAPAGTIEKNAASAALAMVYAQTDEPDKAIDLIEHLLTVPGHLQSGAVYNMTLTDLKWRWQWDPLRSHPRFQKLLAGPEPKTVY